MAAMGLATIVVVATVLCGLRINITPSEPLGVWRIVPLDRPVIVGDLVFICPPTTQRFVEARKRGYLRSGLCPGGYAPLIKTIIALEGQSIEVSETVRIDGRDVASSHLLSIDGNGRPLVPYQGGIVPVGAVFLHSGFPGSWDSRYFGSVPSSGILGLAREVLTYAP